jgi:hypothetical protein
MVEWVESEAFRASQRKQQEYLKTALGLDWGQLAPNRVLDAVGLVTNRWPSSYDVVNMASITGSATSYG